jgi:hypothetical protein
VAEDFEAPEEQWLPSQSPTCQQVHICFPKFMHLKA